MCVIIEIKIMIIIIIIIIIQFNSYLFTCKFNSLEANYKVSTGKKKETTKLLQTRHK
jgi:hypothetical protein